jgi:hypothetical protein
MDAQRQEVAKTVVDQATGASSAEIVRQTTSLFPERLDQFTGSWLDTVDQVSEIADRRGHSNYLVGLSTAILAVGLVWKLQPLGLEISAIGSVEFITVFAVGTLLVLSGSGIRIMQRRAMLETERAKRELAGPILQAQTQLFRVVVEDTVGTQSELTREAARAIFNDKEQSDDEPSGPSNKNWCRRSCHTPALVMRSAP